MHYVLFMPPAKFSKFSELPGLDVAGQASVKSVTGADVQIVRSEIEPGAEFAPHRHPHEQFVVVLDGAIEFEIDGERETLGPMGVFYFEPDVIHGARVIGDRPVHLLEVFAPPRDDYREGIGRVTHDEPR
jgi:quercetin dioxygenase-like cupin family protein